jgi:capsular exopolysaccharide synthesis family protein
MAGKANAETIDVRAIVRKLLAYWWLFGISMGIAGALGVLHILRTQPIYQVQAIMQMAMRSRNAFGAQDDEFMKGMGLLQDRAEFEDNIAVLTSRSSLRKTLRRLNCEISYYEKDGLRTNERYDYPPFFVRMDTTKIQVCGANVHVKVSPDRKTYRVTAKASNVRLYNPQKRLVVEEYVPKLDIDKVVRVGEKFEAENLSFSITFPEDRKYSEKSDYWFTIYSLEDLVDHYRGKLKVVPLSDESNIIVLVSTGPVPNKETAFLDKLMATYIEGEQYRRQQKGLKTINFIDGQIGTVSDSLQRAESTLQSERGTSSMLVDAGRRSDALFEDRSRLLDQRSELMAKRSYYSYIQEYIRNSNDVTNVVAPSSAGIDDPVLNNLILQLSDLVAERAEKNPTTRRADPAMIALERRIETIKSTLLQTADGLLRQAEISLGELNRRLGSIDSQFSQLPENQRKLGAIERRFKLNEDLYNYLMEKRAEAGIAIASDQLDKNVVDAARLESTNPIEPDKKTVLGGALLIGFILPLGFVLVRDFFKDSIADEAELRSMSAIPVLCSIPSSKRKRVGADEPKSLLAESFRTARINLQYLNVDGARQVIGFTSSSSGEGKTFCAVNMASIMAMSGKRVVIVDADMRRPRVHEALGLAEGNGLSTYLIGESALEGIIRPTDIPGLDMISSGPIPPNPLELAEAPGMAELMKQLRSRYDQIVVDASPLGLVSEYVVLVRHIDITLYMVRQGHTKRGALRVVNELYSSKRIGAVNLLLNDATGAQGYGGGYYVK